MAGFTTVTITAGAGDTVKVALESLWANQQVMRNMHLGSSAPSTIVNGMIWIDNTSSTRYVVKLRQNAAWVVLTDKIAEGNRDFDGFQALNFLCEKLTSVNLVSTEARLQFDTTLKMLAAGDGTLELLYQGWDNAFTNMLAIPMSMNVTGLGTPATADTQTRHTPAWLMNAVAEELNLLALERVPAGWPGGTDLFIDVWYLLDAAETANDDPKFDGDLRAIDAEVHTVNKAATALVVSTDDVGSVVTQFSLHRARLTIDHNDATNTVTAGSLISCVLGRTAVGGAGEVAGAIIIGASLMIPAIGAQAE